MSNGYIQIDFKGQQVGLKFNIYGLEKVREKARDRSAIAFFYATIWGGMQGNAYVKEQELTEKVTQVIDGDQKQINIPLTFESVVDWADSLDKKVRMQISEDVTKVMMECQAYTIMTKVDEESLTDAEKKSENEPLLTIT